MQIYHIVKNTPGWSKGRIRLIPDNKLIVNRNTPVGDPPDYWEAKPHGGKVPCYVVASLTLDDRFHLNEYRNL